MRARWIHERSIADLAYVPIFLRFWLLLKQVLIFRKHYKIPPGWSWNNNVKLNHFQISILALALGDCRRLVIGDRWTKCLPRMLFQTLGRAHAPHVISDYLGIPTDCLGSQMECRGSRRSKLNSMTVPRQSTWRPFRFSDLTEPREQNQLIAMDRGS